MSSVIESTVVHAVIDQQLGSSTDGLIAALYVDVHAAEWHVSQQIGQGSRSEDRVWRIAALRVRSVLDLSADVTMLFVVYESDADGIRPLHLYASERLAQCKVQECQSSDQLRRLTMNCPDMKSRRNRIGGNAVR